MPDLTEAWLRQIDAQFEKDRVPPKQRPWLAWQEWIKQTGQPVLSSDDVRNRIFAWFERNTKSGPQYIGPLYIGAFYHEARFWPVIVPLVLGRVQVSAWDALKTMPAPVMKSLWREQTEVREYAAHWANCIDYGFGITEVIRQLGSNDFAQELLKSGNQQMKAVVSLLLDGDRPNSKAIEVSTLATEIFLKAFLAARAALTEAEAKKKIGHNLAEALRRCAAVDPKSELLTIETSLDVFPDIGERYKGTDQPLGVLWRAYEITQFTATTVCRSFTRRDVRKTLRINV